MSQQHYTDKELADLHDPMAHLWRGWEIMLTEMLGTKPKDNVVIPITTPSVYGLTG